MNTWRINLKPAAQADIDARHHCLTKNIVGVGWQIEHNEPPTAEYYEKNAGHKYGDNSWSAAWNAIYYKMKIGDLVWTRDWDGVYYLGRITSDWLYDTSEEASRADIVNIRYCNWVKVGTIEAVPGKLVNCFIPARTLQRVHDETVNLFSQLTYNEKSNSNYYKPTSLKGRDIYSLLSSDDCEDILALYLQKKENFMVLPSSCKTDTMAYEYELIHRETNQKAVVQVKNGYTNLNTDDYKHIEEEVYLFTTKGDYLGNNYKNIYCVSPKEIEQFLYTQIDCLPNKIRIWVELTKGLV